MRGDDIISSNFRIFQMSLMSYFNGNLEVVFTDQLLFSTREAMAEEQQHTQRESKFIRCVLYANAVVCPILAFIHILILAMIHSEKSPTISKQTEWKLMKFSLFCFFTYLVGSVIYLAIHSFNK
jgi:uncharacterized membrane protein